MRESTNTFISCPGHIVLMMSLCDRLFQVSVVRRPSCCLRRTASVARSVSCCLRHAASVVRSPSCGVRRAVSVVRRPSCGVRRAISVVRRPSCFVNILLQTTSPKPLFASWNIAMITERSSFKIVQIRSIINYDLKLGYYM